MADKPYPCGLSVLAQLMVGAVAVAAATVLVAAALRMRGRRG